MLPALQTVMQAACFGKSWNREWCKRIEMRVSRLTNLRGRVHERFGRFELAKHAIQSIVRLVHSCSSEVCATSSRISAMEMAGNPLTKRNSNETNNPIVPMNVL